MLQTQLLRSTSWIVRKTDTFEALAYCAQFQAMAESNELSNEEILKKLRSIDISDEQWEEDKKVLRKSKFAYRKYTAQQMGIPMKDVKTPKLVSWQDMDEDEFFEYMNAPSKGDVNEFMREQETLIAEYKAREQREKLRQDKALKKVNKAPPSEFLHDFTAKFPNKLPKDNMDLPDVNNRDVEFEDAMELKFDYRPRKAIKPFNRKLEDGTTVSFRAVDICDYEDPNGPAFEELVHDDKALEQSYREHVAFTKGIPLKDVKVPKVVPIHHLESTKSNPKPMTSENPNPKSCEVETTDIPKRENSDKKRSKKKRLPGSTKESEWVVPGKIDDYDVTKVLQELGETVEKCGKLKNKN